MFFRPTSARDASRADDYLPAVLSAYAVSETRPHPAPVHDELVAAVGESVWRPEPPTRPLAVIGRGAGGAASSPKPASPVVAGGPMDAAAQRTASVTAIPRGDAPRPVPLHPDRMPAPADGAGAATAAAAATSASTSGDRTALPHERRILADSNDRREWLRARSGGVTATDAAKLATPASVRQVVKDKLYGGSFQGNAYTEFGREREPHIASWVLERHGIPSCGLLFHAEGADKHLATPDGLFADEQGVLLAEIKTTNKPWNRIPRSYLRQVWWQQYVLGAERTLFVWERHRDFVVQDLEPNCVWIERDDAEIARLVALANQVLDEVALFTPDVDPDFPPHPYP